MSEPLYSRHLYLKFLFVIFTVTFSSLICFGQEKVDLELKGTSSVKSISGGEKLLYTFSVTNLSSETAKDVYLNHRLPREGEFVSATVSQGNFKTNSSEMPMREPFVLCHFGDIQGYAEATVNVEIKVNDWGDISADNKKESFMLPSFIGDREDQKPVVKDENLPADLVEKAVPLEILYPDFSCENCNYKEHQFARFLSFNLLPSKNIPPRIELIAPEFEAEITNSFYKAEITRSFKEPLEVSLTVKAFDPDGKIKKVTIPNENLQIDWDDRKYIIEGKKVSDLEIRKNIDYFLPFFEKKFTQTGKDTYSVTVKNLRYGINILFISATDDGGRESDIRVEFTVKSDSTIEFLTPKDQQVLTPDSAIIVETNSKISDGATRKLVLRGTKEFYLDMASPVLMQQSSKAGNIYKHQFIWKNPPEGLYDLQTVLFENDLETNSSKSVRIIVAEPRVIKILTLKNGQEFKIGENIEIAVEVRDKKRQIVNDRLELIIDGKSEDKNINNSLIEGYFPKSYIWQAPYIEEGTHTIQIIAKHDFGVKIAESEIITIKVK